MLAGSGSEINNSGSDRIRIHNTDASPLKNLFSWYRYGFINILGYKNFHVFICTYRYRTVKAIYLKCGEIS